MIKNKEQYEEELRRNAADSYAAYLAKSGIDQKAYLDTLASARAANELGGAGRGSLAESLSSSGLSNSGYRDYLEAGSKRELGRAALAAEEEKALTGYRVSSGYEKYLSDYDKLQKKISESFIESFGKGSIFSIDEAYKQALSAGLNKTFALHTATRAVDTAINAAVEKAIALAKLNSLSAAKARQYAKSLGLSDFYAEKVYKQVAKFNDHDKEYFASMTPEQYYDYIISQKNNK